MFIAFDRKIMLGCRAVKVRASGFTAFESVNARYVATVSSHGLVVNQKALPAPAGKPALLEQISQTVFLLKLTPGPLEFQTLEGVVKAIGLSPCKLCTYCWNGKE